MERKDYHTNLSDQQWKRLQPYPSTFSMCSAYLRRWDLRLIINAILYLCYR